MKANSLLGGLGVGMGLMYLLDPDRGKRRRAVIRDRVRSTRLQSERAWGKVVRDLENRAHGVTAAARSLVNREEVSGDVLAARVRSRLGRLVSHPSAIEVSADDHGSVVLRGPVLAAEHQRLLSGVASVHGVEHVEEHLQPHQTADDVPGLQGGHPPHHEGFELLQTNWAPGPRLLTALAGGALAVYGMRRHGIAGAAAAVSGAALLARSLANREISRLIGVRPERAVDIQKSLHVNAPIEDVFRFWSRYENFPLFMAHLRDVRDLGQGRSHWVAEGPAGMTAEWEVELCQLVSNRLISWRSVPGSQVEHTGAVYFHPEAGGKTRIDVLITYHPPAGAIVQLIAQLLGADPKRAMMEDLSRMKSLLEVGKTRAHGHTVTRASLHNGGPVPVTAH